MVAVHDLPLGDSLEIDSWRLYLEYHGGMEVIMSRDGSDAQMVMTFQDPTSGRCGHNGVPWPRYGGIVLSRPTMWQDGSKMWSYVRSMGFVGWAWGAGTRHGTNPTIP